MTKSGHFFLRKASCDIVALSRLRLHVSGIAKTITRPTFSYLKMRLMYLVCVGFCWWWWWWWCFGGSGMLRHPFVVDFREQSRPEDSLYYHQYRNFYYQLEIWHCRLFL